MLAFYFEANADLADLSVRLASSLGLLHAGKALRHTSENSVFVRLPAHGEALTNGRGWAPARCPRGKRVLFHGWFDNRHDIASELGVPDRDSAVVYGAAVAQWGDNADRRILGHYCAIVEQDDGVRLSRSALRAPPLHYFSRQGAICAASVPRVLHAAGLPTRLNHRKLADNLYFNLTEDEGFYEESYRLGTGQVVHVTPSSRRTVCFFDPLEPRRVPKASAAEYIEEADRLLTEAARVAIAGARQPGVQLSGGLDSSNVAARVLRCLPEPRRLKSFTFLPLATSPQAETDRYFFNERSKVEAFAELHPRLDPYFTDNADHHFDSHLEKMFLAMGTGQGSLPVGFAYHGIYQLARDQGCDLLLSSDMGDLTFSNSGDWGFGEYFRRLKWRQLYLAFRHEPFATRPLHRRFLARSVMGSLPDSAWRGWNRLKGLKTEPTNAAIGYLRSDAMQKYDVERRARRAGVVYERPFYGYRRDLLLDQYGRGDIESADVIQGYEQVYGIALRDVPAYRPLVEFCLGLPTEMFMRDGEQRWLARELGRGIMPEEQRRERRRGYQGSDWHARLTPRLAELREEVRRARAIPDLDALIDFDQVEALLDDWPELPSLDYATVVRRGFALPRVMSTIRYYRYVTGTNAGC